MDDPLWYKTDFSWGLVCVCWSHMHIYVWVHIHACVCLCGSQRPVLVGCFPPSLSPWFSRQVFSPNLELTNSCRLIIQKTPESLLSLSSQYSVQWTKTVAYHGLPTVVRKGSLSRWSMELSMTASCLSVRDTHACAVVYGCASVFSALSWPLQFKMAAMPRLDLLVPLHCVHFFPVRCVFPHHWKLTERRTLVSHVWCRESYHAPPGRRLGRKGRPVSHTSQALAR